jgi:hypothetical protein
MPFGIIPDSAFGFAGIPSHHVSTNIDLFSNNDFHAPASIAPTHCRLNWS